MASTSFYLKYGVGGEEGYGKKSKINLPSIMYSFSHSKSSTFTPNQVLTMRHFDELKMFSSAVL